MFSEKENAYLSTQRLCRLATINLDGQPDVVPVGFEFDGERFFITGRGMTETRKYKNTLSNNRVSSVVDDLESTNPWRPRALKCMGSAVSSNAKGSVV